MDAKCNTLLFTVLQTGSEEDNGTYSSCNLPSGNAIGGTESVHQEEKWLHGEVMHPVRGLLLKCTNMLHINGSRWTLLVCTRGSLWLFNVILFQTVQN